jgi:excisionase family DNA binding protein
MHPELASGPEQSDAAPLAYSVDQLPYGRTYVYELIRQGKLKAKKSGRRTLITAEAWKEHLASLPDLETSAA